MKGTVYGLCKRASSICTTLKGFVEAVCRAVVSLLGNGHSRHRVLGLVKGFLWKGEVERKYRVIPSAVLQQLGMAVRLAESLLL